ncbi:ribonuclease HII [Candidatus Sumerlaeota bacterium]|nr:ribonuclease HII [Candidatus Sumerlaeota bacterium]
MKRSPKDLERLARFDAEFFGRPGIGRIAGIDEAGRGALAGPVVAAAVVADRSFRVEGLNDSKQLSPARRETLFETIHDRALGVGVGLASAREIDRINILQATFLAARRALESLALQPDLILTDALKLTDQDTEVVPLVKGDARSQVIAAASVVAKVTRDRLMTQLDAEFPDYGFAAHKGYGVESHLEALRRHGSSTLHRHTFRGVDWFDRPVRPSRTLERLLSELGADGPGDPLVSWRTARPELPECELEMLREAVAQRQSGA